ncbi:MAG: restriction endonuclease subunit S [Chitinispirillaceae bacterium]|nr:restriction endonuclease subunit S [Chitinispirillaceae bacterium]
MSDWHETTLAGLSENISYGYTASAESQQVGPRFLRITDIQNGVVDWASVPYCQIGKENIDKYRLEYGDIVVARTGNSTGENYLFKSDKETVFASYLIRFKIKKQQADPLFVWYNLRSKQWWSFIAGSKTGSAQAGANAKVLGQFPINLPPLPIQCTIASILGSLDDKIELNHRMNETLEATARALYKSWFVDFDPVKAKAEGRKPFGMDDETAALFPDGFEESKLGKIPKGWRVGEIGELVNAVGGTTPSTNDPSFWDSGEIPFVTPKDLAGLSSRALLKTERMITQKGLQQISSGLLPRGTVLLSSRAPIGYLAITEMPVAINQGFIAMVCNEQILPNHFVLRWTEDNMPTIIGNANGTTFLEISKKNFRPIAVIVPDIKVVHKFTEIAGDLHLKVVSNLVQNENLMKLRDFLLPSLLSGELKLETRA